MNIRPDNLKARLIAFYLPQYYPTPENDLWWGKGFTEWTNVTRAKPLFPGHQQPNLPADLGFYDLRVPEVREAQAELARGHGIEGFCYWHYWFGEGRRMLDRVFDEVLDSGKPDFPFCLAWANETWNRGWHGREQEVLLEQKYPGEKDYREHFNFLLRAFRDPRYIRVDGKPLFIIYEPSELPAEVITYFRKFALEAGLPGLFIPGVCDEFFPLAEKGLDARIPSQPASFHALAANGSELRKPSGAAAGICQKIRGRLRQMWPFPGVYFYLHHARNYLKMPPPAPDTFPSPLVNWDNTPRCKRRGDLYLGATPEAYRLVLRKAIADVADRPREQRLVFLKSWNEWAEGNHLEPGRQYGHGYLRVTKEEVIA
jgi:hypothetical protein